MSVPRPTNDQVRAAMDHILDEAAAAGRRATISAVERHLGVPHATFHRNYSSLISGHFRRRANADAATQGPDAQGQTSTVAHAEDNLQRLRHENRDLRRLVDIYEEAIRQLTLTNDQLRSELPDAANVSDLSPRRVRR